MRVSPIVQRTKRGASDERATSPAIGAILLVGITVIVAATVGGQIASFSGTEQQPFAIAPVEFDAADDRLSVTWRANTNADRVQVTVVVGDHHRTVTLTEVGHTMTVDFSGVTVRKGTVTSWNHPATTDGNRVSVTVVAVKNGNSIVLAERTESI